MQSLWNDARQSWIIDPDVVLQDFVRTQPEHDRAAFEAEADMWRHTLAATYSQEGGYATDLNLVIGPWQLDLSAMKVPVRAWHGSNDLSAPIGLVQKVVEATRGELVMIPGQGHYIDAKFHAEMIRWLVDPH